MFVTIAKANPADADAAEETDLQIHAGPVRFFIQPVQERFKGSMRQTGDISQWRLQFFYGTDFEQQIAVSFHENEPPRADWLAQAMWQELANDSPSTEQIARASQWLRGSNSLTLDHYEDRGGQRLICVDGKCLAMFSPKLQKPTFERSVLLLALACAYRLGIESRMTELSRGERHSKEIARLALDATRFNAWCYSQHPVGISAFDLGKTWTQLATQFRLQETNQELVSQLGLLHQIVSEQKRDQEQRRWQIASVAIALFSAVQIIDLLPAGIRTSSWVAVLGLFGGGQ